MLHRWARNSNTVLRISPRMDSALGGSVRLNSGISGIFIFHGTLAGAGRRGSRQFDRPGPRSGLRHIVGGRCFLCDPLLQHVGADPKRLGGPVNSVGAGHLTAAFQSGSGMGERTLRIRRTWSNRRRKLPSRAGRPRVPLLAVIRCPPPDCILTANDTTRLKMIHARLPKGHDDSRLTSRTSQTHSGQKSTPGSPSLSIFLPLNTLRSSQNSHSTQFPVCILMDRQIVVEREFGLC